jgi:hypothetical protein
LGRAPATETWVPIPRSTCREVVGDARTPGWSSVNWLKSRPLSGSSRICCESTTAEIEELVVSITGDSPLTVTASVIVPTPIVTFRVRLWPTLSRISGRRVNWNPCNSTVTSYVPGSRPAAR